MQPGRRRVIAEIDKRPSYDPPGVVGDKPQPAVLVKEGETKSPRIFTNAALAAACKFPLMHEPLNLDRLKAEVSAYNARVDLKGAVTLNLNLVHDKPPMRALALALAPYLARRLRPRCARTGLARTGMPARTPLPPGVIASIVDAEASVLCVLS
jgi:hypothetical protein